MSTLFAQTFLTVQKLRTITVALLGDPSTTCEKAFWGCSGHYNWLNIEIGEIIVAGHKNPIKRARKDKSESLFPVIGEPLHHEEHAF